MRIKYDKTTWVDNETPVNASNMNKIENALETLFDTALTPSSILNTGNVTVSTREDGIELNYENRSVPDDGFLLRQVYTKPENSLVSGNPGDFYLELDRNVSLGGKMYLCVKQDFWLCFDGRFTYPDSPEE